MRFDRSNESGFQLIDVLLTTVLIAIVAGIAVPGIQNEVDKLKLGMSTRDVQSELQTARLKAVSSNTYMRVRFNCPAADQFRVVERIGTPNSADAGDDLESNAAARCNPSNYPYRPTGLDSNRVTKPNNDGPLRYLQSSVTFSGTTGLTAAPQKVIEFWPDGTVHAYSATPPWPQIATTGVTIVLQKGSVTKTITVGNLGNIQMER